MGFRGDLSINWAEAPKVPNKDAQDRMSDFYSDNEENATHLFRKREGKASEAL